MSPEIEQIKKIQDRFDQVRAGESCQDCDCCCPDDVNTGWCHAFPRKEKIRYSHWCAMFRKTTAKGGRK